MIHQGCGTDTAGAHPAKRLLKSLRLAGLLVAVMQQLVGCKLRVACKPGPWDMAILERLLRPVSCSLLLLRRCRRPGRWICLCVNKGSVPAVAIDGHSSKQRPTWRCSLGLELQPWPQMGLQGRHDTAHPLPHISLAQCCINLWV